MSGSFSPGQAAEQSGFSLDTLRYYERIGLLDGIEAGQPGWCRAAAVEVADPWLSGAHVVGGQL